MMTVDDMYSRDRIESVRSRFLNKVVRCNLLGAALRATVTAVTDDGRVDVQCSPLGFTPFTEYRLHPVQASRRGGHECTGYEHAFIARLLTITFSQH